MSLLVHLGGEYSSYENSTTGHCSPRRGIPFSGTIGDDASSRPRVRRRPGCGLDSCFVYILE